MLRSFVGVGTAAILSAVLALSACSEAPFVPDRAAAPPLYEITNSEGEIEGWLFGTIHSLPDGVNWRTPELASVIDQADTLFVEIAALDDRTRLQRAFAELANSPNLLPLSLRVRPSYRAGLERLIERSSYSERDFSDVETWAAALLLARVGSFGDPDNGVDLAIIREFDRNRTFEFEGAFVQLGIFDRLAAADQRDLLRGVIDETKRSDSQPGRLARAWYIGDTNALVDATRTGIMADQELRDALLVDRNRAWIEQLLPVLDRSPRPLVAVGAGHLVGPDGLVAMLKSEGYSVRSLHPSD